MARPRKYPTHEGPVCKQCGGTTKSSSFQCVPCSNRIAREHYQKHKERRKIQMLAYTRKLYHTDPEYREKRKATMRERYRTDPEYRARSKLRSKIWYAKKKLTDPNYIRNLWLKQQAKKAAE